ncbi:hypothetical protein Vadar_028220 [Vaccinium darrowii]|uniref:Uncharacterized protein n=1 Tax=Vaccinium darrowii TaxID=229202 RepID=A0ACB7ZFU1_9ERIC|nr:hypothetical protein Vadar_028220 [Vaccinium darrowii]
MPESFAWSHKRRYKTGYIWQDLLDEDLITPISDNEYVLKGSEIPSINLSSAVADDSVKLEEENSMKLEEEKTSVEKNQETLRISANASTLTKNNSKKTKKEKNNANNPSTPASSTSSSQFTKTSKSYPSNVFRLLITCGRSLDTNESAIMINKKNSCYTPSKKPGVEKIACYRNTTKICKEDKLGGSERVFRASWLQEQKPRPNARKSCDGLKSSSNNSKPVSAAYQPINGPNCS